MAARTTYRRTTVPCGTGAHHVIGNIGDLHNSHMSPYSEDHARPIDGVRTPRRRIPLADPTAPRFLTVAEVAEMCRVSRMTVYRWVHAGDLPAVRFGKSFRVPQAAAQEFLSKAHLAAGYGEDDETGATAVG